MALLCLLFGSLATLRVSHTSGAESNAVVCDHVRGTV